MAATARNRLPFSALLLVLAWGLPLHADRAADIRTQLGNISTSLASADPSDAMEPFDKSYANYEKLSEDFAGLAVFQIENEVDVTDEEDTADGAKIVINWALTLTDLGTNRTDHRTAVINARLVLKGGKWKIVEFSPIAIFNPLPYWNTKP
jgi:hypothetical protein